MTPDALTVVVPVHGHPSQVQACLDSVIRHAPSGPPFDLLVIDDASPDDEVGPLLEAQLAADLPFSLTVERNDSNLGFAATVNRGMQATTGDVVLLNSDTIVTDGWLARLTEVASLGDVATVTPLTNEGSIVTLPPDLIEAFGLAGANPQIDACGAFVTAHSLHLHPEVITGVGFCLLVTRRAIDLVGPFDHETFGRGYGEEVDFCLRATDLGLRHLVDDATFVYHEGGASFGAESSSAKALGSDLLHERHPGFRTANRAERRRDPLRVALAGLQQGLTVRDESRPHVLHVLHTPSVYGGTEKHLDALVDALAPAFDASILTPGPAGFVLRTRWTTADGRRVEEAFLVGGRTASLDTVADPVAGDTFASVLELFAFDAVHVHNLIGHSLAPLDQLRDFDGPVICTVHDYFLACPHHWLLYRNEVACGVPDDLELCAACLPETRGLPVAALQDLRAAVAERIDVIDRWLFPSHSAADQLRIVHDIDPDRIVVIPHGTVIPVDPARRTVDEPHIHDDPLRVAFVGRGWAKKGLDVANHLADHLAGTSIEVHHFGERKEPPSDHLVEHGPYDNRRLPELLRAAGVHVVLLPGPYAETFGLVMTESLAAGLPVIGTAYGAIGERIRDLGVGWTIDPDDTDGVVALVEDLDACRLELLAVTRRAAATDLASVADTAPAYAALYRSRTLDDRAAPTRGATP